MRLRTLKEKLLPKDTPAYRRRNAREIFLIGLPMVIGVKPTLLSDQKINASLRIKSIVAVGLVAAPSWQWLTRWVLLAQ
jgi:hypothetical protein